MLCLPLGNGTPGNSENPEDFDGGSEKKMDEWRENCSTERDGIKLCLHSLVSKRRLLQNKQQFEIYEKNVTSELYQISVI